MEHQFRQSQDTTERKVNIYKTIALEIESETGVLIPFERLRQFAKGIPSQADKTQRTFPKRLKDSKHMEALVGYVTNASSDKKAVFEQLHITVGDHASMLSESMAKHFHGPSNEPISIHSSLRGTFLSSRTSNGATFGYLFVVQPSLIPNVFDVVLIQTVSRGVQDHSNQVVAEERWVGWAVMDADEKFIGFLKSQLDESNIIAEIVGYELLPEEGGRPNLIRLNIHKYPIFLEREQWENRTVVDDYIRESSFDFSVEKNE